MLVVKPQAEEKAREISGRTSINITTEGRKYLGGFIGSKSGCRKYTEQLISSCFDQLTVMLKIEKTEPQAAFTAFVSGFKHNLTYYIKTIPNIKHHLMQYNWIQL